MDTKTNEKIREIVEIQNIVRWIRYGNATSILKDWGNIIVKKQERPNPTQKFYEEDYQKTELLSGGRSKYVTGQRPKKE